MFRFLTAGESHGPQLTAIVEGCPAGLRLGHEDIDKDLARRQTGYGRGGRMKIETDKARITSGVRFGVTLGSPISLVIENKDWANWQKEMAVDAGSAAETLSRPRPGHADLPGILKTGQTDIRDILERASARETAARVAVGAVAKRLLAEFGITVFSHVVAIGDVSYAGQGPTAADAEKIDASAVRCLDANASEAMKAAIDAARHDKDTLGGVFEVLIFGLPPGIGGYTHWDLRLNSLLAQALMSIPAIKGVEVGEGFALAAKRGSQAHDEIFYDKDNGYHRQTNRAGGVEGGMSNGETVSLRVAMKPIPTLSSPLKTVDIATREAAVAIKERSDICAVPAAAVIGESVAAIALVNPLMAKFGGDSVAEMKRAYTAYLAAVSDR